MNSKKLVKIWKTVLVEECAQKTAAEQKKLILRLKEVLKSKKKDYLLACIVRGALAEMKKRAKFEIVFARKQSPEVVDKLEKKLSRGLDADEDADIEIDASLIGGFVALTDKYLVDASIKGQLDQLRKNF